MGVSAGSKDATLERRLVMRGDPGTPVVEDEFFVASYQRGYRWGRSEVRKLLDDIRDNGRSAAGSGLTPPDYHLQPVVVLRRDDSSWELVDGQQRLTTLYLVAKYIGTRIQDARVEYSLTYETRDRSRAFLEELDFSQRDDNIDFFHIAAAYDAIEEWFEDEDHGPASKTAMEIYLALTTWVYVIWYEAPEGTNPNALFTRLNRDRIALTDAELIKAVVLSGSRSAVGDAGRRAEVAAQWDGFERDLRDGQLWAFLTGSSATRQTHIDLLFETMTPTSGMRRAPRYWTFDRVREEIERRDNEAGTDGERGAVSFWREVVARHGLLVGWYQDRTLYHRIGYLVAVGTSIKELVEASIGVVHSEFAESLREWTRHRLGVSRSGLSLLRYDRDGTRCSSVLLLMNVETVLASKDSDSRFSFRGFARDGWSLEHIHAQNAAALTKEAQRRDWLVAHAKVMRSVAWGDELHSEVEIVLERMDAHLALPPTRTDDVGFQLVLDKVFELFGSPGAETTEESVHGLANLVLLQREFNSRFGNGVFALKRERMLELDEAGEYLLPCTKNVFLKYYTPTEDQQLSIWGPQDRQGYYEKLQVMVEDFLLPDAEVDGGAEQ